MANNEKKTKTENTEKNNASIIPWQLFLQAGIDPKTGLPLKVGNILTTSEAKESIKQVLQIIDEQDAVNRYKWYNLPLGLSSQDLERLLYYKGQLAFFYLEGDKQFYIMPYALDGGIDFYGRFKSIHPIPFNEGTSDDEKKQIAKQRNYLSTLKLECTYEVLTEAATKQDMISRCVLLQDYTPQLSQTIVARTQLQQGLIDIMSDCLPFMRTALLNSTGIQGVRVNSEDEQSNVEAASALINSAALTGRKYIALVGKLDFQDLTGGEVAKAEEFLLAMQALDNFRLGSYGIENGGIFEKRAHVLQSEQNMNNNNTGLIYNDGLARRQRFCDICNSIWGLGMWCDASESVTGMDMNADGMIMDEMDQSGIMPGEQPQGGDLEDVSE